MDRALNAEEVQKIAGIPIRVVKYSTLCEYNSLDDLFGKCKGVLILYERKKNIGHWVCLTKHPKMICFYDSYGFIPDDELHFTNIKFRKANNMDYPYLTYLLYHSKKKIDYNDKQMQKEDDHIETCGYHCGLRMRLHKLTNDEYYNIFKDIPLDQMDPLIVELTKKYID